MLKFSYRIVVATVMAAIGLTAYSQYAVKADQISGSGGPGRVKVSLLEGTRVIPVRENEQTHGHKFQTLNTYSSGPQMSRMPIMAPSRRDGLEFYGSIVYAEQQSPGVNYPGREWSLASFTPSGEFTPLFDCWKANGSGVFIDNVYHFVYKFIKQLPTGGPDAMIDITNYYELDMNTGVVTGPEEIGHRFIATDVTFDETTQKAYGCFYNDDLTEFEFGTVDYRNRERTTICTLPIALNAIAADKDGTLYAVDMNGDFCKVDKNTGAKTVIGATGYVPCYVTSGAIDPKTGDFYWTVSPEGTDSYLCSIDKATGKATLVYKFPYCEEITTLYIPAPAAEDKAPAIVKDMSLSFEKGSLNGEVSFTMPSKLFDGTAASGSCQYVILVDGDKIAEGNANYGENVIRKIEIATPGKKEICVYTENSAGRSPMSKISSFIGHGTPSTPSNIIARYADGSFTINWDAVTNSFDGGYIDPSAVTYTVTAYPTGDVVAKDIKSTTATYKYQVPDEFGIYYFIVQAKYNGLTSATGHSNKMPFGTISLPYSEDFESSDSLEGWSIRDANDDGISWIVSSGELFCLANPMLDMDDWCISPEMKLEAGRWYVMEADVRGASNEAPEDFEICIGRSNNPDEFEDVVIGPQRVLGSTPQHFRGYFTVEETGVYYIGIHGISMAFTSALIVDNLAVAGPLDNNIPAAVTKISSERGLAPDGSNLAIISFTAPTKSIDGKPLGELTKIELERPGLDSPLTVTDCAPGKAVSVEDRIPELGRYTYEITAFNKAGAGQTVRYVADVNVYQPKAPDAIVFSERGNTGHVDILWSEVTQDMGDFPIDKSDLKYDIMQSDGDKVQDIATGLTDTKYDYQAVAEGSQRFTHYIVAARNSAGSSIATRSNTKAVGTAYTAPWTESLRGMSPTSIIASATLSADAQWTAISNEDLADGLTEYDNDGGMFAMTSTAANGQSVIQFGKVDISKLSKPTFSLAVHNTEIDGMQSENVLTLEALVDDQWKTICNWVIKDACGSTTGWNRLSTGLSDFASENFQFRLRGTTINMSLILVDALTISNGFNTDAAVASVKAPERMKSGKDYTVSATVGNYGKNFLNGLSVNCYADNDLVGSQEIKELKPGETRNLQFTVTPNGAYPSDFKFHVEVKCDGDENLADNSLESNEVQMQRSSLPSIGDLSHKDDLLSWTAPEYEGITVSEEVLETFDDFKSFEYQDLGQWTTLDADGSPTFRVSGATFGNLENGMPLSYFVMDTAAGDYNDTWKAYSGTKYLTNIGAAEGNSDDWLISPELSGAEQEVSFYARSYNPLYKETFEFLVSDSGKNAADFKSEGRHEGISEEWTKFVYKISEGCKYFAIRSVSDAAFMFQIDDISYSPAFPVDLKLLGYNIYAGKKKLNETPVIDCAFSTKGIETPTFAVSAVYNAGESFGVYVGNSGVAQARSVVSVYGSEDCIRILGAEGNSIEVYTVAGAKVFSNTADSSSLIIPVCDGIYVVRVAGKTYKVIVG